MHVHQLKAFLVLADELNYRHAAERLSLSQPGLTGQINRLERDLGARLFLRSRFGTQLTETGRRLLPLAEAAVSAVDDLVSAARRPRPDLEGQHPRRLRVGLLGDGLGRTTWALLGAFNKIRPDVEITLTPLSFLAAFTAIDNGLADVVLVTGPATGTDRQQVTTVDYEPISALLTLGHPLINNGEVDLELISRRLTYDTPRGGDPAFRRFWTQQQYRQRATRDLTPLRGPPDGPVLGDLVQRFSHIGGVGLWPTSIPLGHSSGAVTVALDRPLDAPRQILSDTRNDHAAALLRIVKDGWPTYTHPTP